jgi:hypothetical protein
VLEILSIVGLERILTTQPEAEASFDCAQLQETAA